MLSTYIPNMLVVAKSARLVKLYQDIIKRDECISDSSVFYDLAVKIMPIVWEHLAQGVNFEELSCMSRPPFCKSCYICQEMTTKLILLYLKAGVKKEKVTKHQIIAMVKETNCE